jgi:hypothetical protein
MKNFLLLISFFFVVDAFSASTRTIDADAITSSNHSFTWTFPTSTGTVVLSGQLPIAAQFQRDVFAGNSSTTAFTLSNTPPVVGQVQVFVNGLLMIYTTDYTISGTTLTFVSAPVTGQTIHAIYSRF